MTLVTVSKNGVTATVDETTPGLFGTLGYTYVNKAPVTTTAPSTTAPTTTTTPTTTDRPENTPLTSIVYNGKTYDLTTAAGRTAYTNAFNSAPSTTPKPQTSSTYASQITYQGKTYDLATADGMAAYKAAINGTTPASATAPTAPTPVTTPTSDVPAAKEAPASTTVMIPTSDLQPGMTGDEVKQLQNYLVSKGYMTQAQVDTGYGIYGPQTTAAVAALQKSLGVDNSSGVGYFGPKTRAALQTASGTSLPSAQSLVDAYKAGGNLTADQIIGNTALPSNDPAVTGNPVTPATDTGKTPTQNIIDIWSQVSDELGLSDIKDQYNKTLDDQKAMEDDMNTDIAEVNNNPWYSEGKRQMEVKKIQDKYSTKLDTLSNYAKLYDSLYQEGLSTAKYLTTGIQDDQQYALDLAQKKQAAIDALSKDNVVVDVMRNGVMHSLLINKNTGAEVADLGVSKSTTTSTNQKSDINDIIFQFQTKMKQMQWRGVNPDDYQVMADYLQSTYGTQAVAALKTAMNAVGIKVDTGQTLGFQ